MKLQNNEIGPQNDKWRQVNGHYVPGRKFSAIKYNAARRGIPFDLTIEYLDELWLLQNGQCLYSGEDLDITSRNGATASLDRKNSNLGYVEGNVAWVHNDVNYLKHTLDEDRLFELIEKIHERRKNIDTTENYHS
jgi:hypothetical protein